MSACFKLPHSGPSASRTCSTIARVSLRVSRACFALSPPTPESKPRGSKAEPEAGRAFDAVVTAISLGNLELLRRAIDRAYRLRHDRTYTTVAHHLDPSHRADALRRPEVAGDRALARNGHAGVQRHDHRSNPAGAVAATRAARSDRTRPAADRARHRLASA